MGARQDVPGQDGLGISTAPAASEKPSQQAQQMREQRASHRRHAPEEHSHARSLLPSVPYVRRLAVSSAIPPCVSTFAPLEKNAAQLDLEVAHECRSRLRSQVFSTGYMARLY